MGLFEGLGADLRSLLAATRVVVDPTDLMLVGLPREAAPLLAAALSWGEGFCSLTVDAYEASVVLPAAAWEGIAGRFPGARTAGPYRLITLDIVLDFGVVGYLAVIARALAGQGICVYALSAHARDHLLVRREDVEAAQDCLNGLVERARSAAGSADGV